MLIDLVAMEENVATGYRIGWIAWSLLGPMVALGE